MKKVQKIRNRATWALSLGGVFLQTTNHEGATK